MYGTVRYEMVLWDAMRRYERAVKMYLTPRDTTRELRDNIGHHGTSHESYLRDAMPYGTGTGTGTVPY